jgi:hypothetical protein
MDGSDALEFEGSQMLRTTATSKIGNRLSTSSVNRVVAASVLIAFAAGHCGASPVTAGPVQQQLSDTSGQAYYEGAFTLIDLPAGDLMEALPDLSGLVPAADQQPLPRLLSEVGKNVEEAYQKFTEVIADEQVTRVRCGPEGRLETISRQEFTYLIIPHHEGGLDRIEEYRTAIGGKPGQSSETGALSAEGFAAMWALFYPGNQSGSRFCYLGQQRFGERQANVIGFAQRPGWSLVKGLEYPHPVGRPVLILYQGVVWVDAATNKILKMRAALLKPRLDIKLELQTTEICFGEVHVSDAASTSLWVPLQVTVTTVWNGQVLGEEHLYSNYKLPGSNTKIQAVPAETLPPSKTN